jgi:hypothetical protein
VVGNEQLYSDISTEYKSFANAMAKVTWVHKLLDELGIAYPMAAYLWCDNIGETYLVS